MHENTVDRCHISYLEFMRDVGSRSQQKPHDIEMTVGAR